MNFKTTERLKACYSDPQCEEHIFAAKAAFLVVSNPEAGSPEGWDIDGETFNW